MWQRAAACMTLPLLSAFTAPHSSTSQAPPTSSVQPTNQQPADDSHNHLHVPAEEEAEYADSPQVDGQVLQHSLRCQRTRGATQRTSQLRQGDERAHACVCECVCGCVQTERAAEHEIVGARWRGCRGCRGKGEGQGNTFPRPTAMSVCKLNNWLVDRLAGWLKHLDGLTGTIVLVLSQWLTSPTNQPTATNQPSTTAMLINCYLQMPR